MSSPSSRSRSRNGCLSFDHRAPTLHCFVCDLFDVGLDGLNRQIVQHAKYSRGDALSHLQDLRKVRAVNRLGLRSGRFLRIKATRVSNSSFAAQRCS